MNLEAELQKRRSIDQYDYETDHFTDSILKREIVESPQAGTLAPSFSLLDETGTEVTLSSLLAKGPCILSFVKGTWCNYCGLELKAMQRVLPEFKKHGATLLAISPHTVSLTQEMKEEKGLGYSILSDAGNEIAYKYGLRFQLQPRLMDVFAQFGFGESLQPIHGDQGDNTNTLPIPGTFVISPDGTVIFSFVNSDHTKRAEPAEIIAALMTVAS